MGLIKQQLEQPAGYWQISGKSIFTVSYASRCAGYKST